MLTCFRYNHFVPSSSLLANINACRTVDMFPGTLDVSTKSPTSGHLSIILNLIAMTYNKSTPVQTLLLLSNWMQEICVQSEKYIGILSKTRECQSIMTSLITCGATPNNDIASAVCDLLKILMTPKDVVWKQEIYSNIIELITLHLTSKDEKLREKYSILLILMPINIVIPKLNIECLFSDTKVSVFFKESGICNIAQIHLQIFKRCFTVENTRDRDIFNRIVNTRSKITYAR